MELIMNIIAYGAAFFKFLFAVPVLGLLFLAGVFGPMIIKALKRW